MFIESKLAWIILKRFDFILFDPVCYFRLATESDDSVAKSVESNFYYFANEIPF
jgi:hypothetical protein